MADYIVLTAQVAQTIVETLSDLHDAEVENNPQFAQEIDAMCKALQENEVTGTRAGDMEKFMDVESAVLIWDTEELEGCPPEAVTESAWTAGSSVIAEYRSRASQGEYA